MKKIFLALALLASVQVANAQAKGEAATKAAVEKAQADAANPKKATKLATWTKLGQTLVDAYNAPAGNGWVGAQQAELKLVMSGLSPLNSEMVVVGGREMQKDSYASADYYYDGGVLAMIVPTKEYVADALEKACEAYAKAAELDPAGKKSADISAALEGINQKYIEEAFNNYQLGNLSKASKLFEKAAKAFATAPCSKIDTNSIYNAGFTAWQVGENDRAIDFFEKCVKYGYLQDGETYSKLADAIEKVEMAKVAADATDEEKAVAEKAAKAASKDVLEAGFKACPQSQSILIGLINYYVGSGENTGRLFELLDEAKKNEPDNASLYYVEGNIHDKLGEKEEAIKSYLKCSEVNPDYEYGYVGLGILHYNNAIEIQDKAANEFDDRKWEELNKQFEQELKACIEPFEKAYAICKDSDVKVSIAEYLKNACYRFRDEDASYSAMYEKYKTVVETGVAD